MSVLKGLFLIYSGNISVFLKNHSKDKYENITFMGESRFSVKEFNWNWWAESVGYNSVNDTVDFCFICDKADFTLPDYKFSDIDESNWDIYDVVSFLSTQVDIKNLSIRNVNSGEVYFGNENSENLFFTNSDLGVFDPESIEEFIIDDNKPEKEELSTGNGFADYFYELRKKQKELL